MNVIAGEATIEQLYNKAYVWNIADFYELGTEHLLSLEGWKEKSAERFLKSLEESKKTPFEKVLYALGIRYVGESTAKSIAIDNALDDSLHILDFDFDNETFYRSVPTALQALKNRLADIKEELKILLLPKDKNDERRCMLEVRAGTDSRAAHSAAAQRRCRLTQCQVAKA